MQELKLNPYNGEFLDPEMEAAYRQSAREATKRQLRATLLVIAALFPLLGVIDYLMMESAANFRLMLAMRAGVSLACMLLAFNLRRHPVLFDHPLPLNAVIVLLLSCIILLVPLRPATIEAQFAAIIGMTLIVYYLIPNRIPWMIGLAAYVGLGFLLAIRLWGPADPAKLAAAALALVVINVMGLLPALRQSRLKREHFASLQAEQEANSRLQAEILERRRLEDELRHLAQVDDLTGACNRRWFIELAGQELRHARRSGEALTVCMLDLDNFKAFNDRLGHAAGDVLLAEVAQLCKEELRDSDILGRFGGDEFIIALPDTGVESAFQMAERLRGRIESHALPPAFGGRHLTVTLGLSAVKSGEDSLEPALQRADQALYEGKHEGRNVCVIAVEGKAAAGA